MMDTCSRFFRITTTETDLFKGKGYKFANDAASLKKALGKFNVIDVECKTSSLDSSSVYYRSMSKVDLDCVLVSV